MIASLLNAQDFRQQSYNKYKVTSSYTFKASSAGGESVSYTHLTLPTNREV